MKYLLLLTLPLFAADHWFGGTAWPRHQAMIRHFTTNSYQGKYLLGTLDGWRPRLARRGITVSGSYVQDPLTNLTGGRSRGFTNAGSLGVDLNIHHPPWSFYTSIVYRSGTSLTSRRIGNQFPVQQVFGGQNLRLNELYLRYGTDGFVAKLGRLDGGNDFLQNPLYYHYVCNAFDGNPIGIFFNTPFTAYPNSTWGLYASLGPIPVVEIKGAIYNANSQIKENRFHGINFTFKNTDGWLLMTEWNLLPPGGRYNIAGWWQTGSGGNWGCYIMADQKLCRFTLWTALLFSPQKRSNLIPFYMNWGLVFDVRGKDTINLGVAFGEFRRPQTSETIVELNYWWQITHYFYITPALQWVHNPRGLGTIRDAFCIGGQTGVIF